MSIFDNFVSIEKMKCPMRGVRLVSRVTGSGIGSSSSQLDVVGGTAMEQNSFTDYLFKFLDRNGDGLITADEFLAFLRCAAAPKLRSAVPSVCC